MSEWMVQEGKAVLRRLTDAGFEAYFVGGYVRDQLLSRPLKDIDIATSALPDEVVRLFPRTAPTGLKHGTVTVIMTHHVFEVTTFRKESEYEHHRRPKEVEFISDLHEDLKRRDFTINAMAQDLEERYIDPFGGVDDLKNRIVRCVGNPVERFEEDALRMLRGIRFACEYGFELEAETWRALCEHAQLLVHVAMERVTAELERMIEGHAPDRAVALLARSGLLRHCKQAVGWPFEQWGEAPALFDKEALVQLNGAEARWAGLFIVMGMPGSECRRAMKQLKLSGKKIDSVAKLVECDAWMKERQPDPDAAGGQAGEFIAQACIRFGKDHVLRWLLLAGWQSDVIEQALPFLRRLADSGADFVQQVPISSLKELRITGNEIVAASDRRPGPWLGELMQELLEDAAMNKIPNEPESLLKEALKRMERISR